MFISCFNVRGGVVIIPVTLSSCNNKKESSDDTFKEPEVYLKDQFEVHSGDSYVKYDKNLNDSNFIFSGPTGDSSGSFTTSFDELFVIKNKPLDLISLHGCFRWFNGMFNEVDIRDYDLSDHETIGWKITCAINSDRNPLSIQTNTVTITYWNSKLDEEETFSDIIKNVPTSVTLVRA